MPNGDDAARRSALEKKEKETQRLKLRERLDQYKITNIQLYKDPDFQAKVKNIYDTSVTPYTDFLAVENNLIYNYYLTHKITIGPKPKKAQKIRPEDEGSASKLQEALKNFYMELEELISARKKEYTDRAFTTFEAMARKVINSKKPHIQLEIEEDNPSNRTLLPKDFEDIKKLLTKHNVEAIYNQHFSSL